MRWIILLAIVASFSWSSQLHAEAVHLADGDSFRLGERRYRLYGIDAPELHQDCKDADGETWPCGRRARTELRRIIGTHPLECRPVTTDRFGRIIATCVAGGRDVAEEMVRSGYATTFNRPGSSNRYDEAQAQARADKRGLWVGAFEIPQEWRRGHPRDAESSVMTPRDWLDQKIVAIRQALDEWWASIFGR